MNNHNSFIKKTFILAQKGNGNTSPNPLVGSVLVKDGVIIGEGLHEKYGDHHAEVNAINDCLKKGFSPEEATLYCNLEPCCHTNKQTPPCTDLIIKSKIKAVIISNIDPNPFVDGGGKKILESHGIEVSTGILEFEGRELNKVFFKYIKNKTPYIHLKWAQTLDGKMATNNGDSKWISDDSARGEVHELRQSYDAVMVGANTLNNDNPSLNVRLNNSDKVPFRIIIGNNLNLDSKILTDKYIDKTIVITTNKNLIKILTSIGIKVIETSKLKVALKEIGEMKISSILVEGGGKLLTSFIEENLYDEATIYIAPKLIGPGRACFTACEKNLMSEATQFNQANWRILNDQAVLNIRNN